MAHIELPEHLPGIIGPMTAYPETARALNGLAETLLTNDSPTLSRAERETVAAYVSFLNGCVFCSESHAAVADVHWDRPGFSRAVWQDSGAGLDGKLKALLAVAKEVQAGGRTVTAATVEHARKAGADDRAIHDTVLIAAAFCMFNRYVDGLATPAPRREHPSYLEMGQRLATKGYLKATSG